MSKLRRRNYDEAIRLCTQILAENPYDRAVWFLKCRALTLKDWIDDTEMEEEGVGDLLLDENAVAATPRPGTSLSKPATGGNNNGVDQSVRPVSSGGRPVTGFARPGTSSLGGDQKDISVEKAFKGSRPGTSRPMTSLGRQVRLGTASMISDGGVFINIQKLNLRKYASRPALAKALCDYLIYHEHNPRIALELSALATVQCDYKDWWWKARLGKCYYQLGLLRDSEKQFKSSLRQQSMVVSVLELCKVYVKLDQPNTAIETYLKSSDIHTSDTAVLLGAARIHDMLNDVDEGVKLYTKVLQLDASCVEAIACLASHHFYSDQPEVALQYFQRLAQMGLNSTELWNNLGLCCFYASQYDMALNCFEQALALADDENMADVWYNIGQISIGIGDLGLAYQAFKIGVSINSNHAECYNNLGVLELRKGSIAQARSNFQASQRIAPYMFESFFNGALLAYKLGNHQESYKLVSKSLEAYPNHSDSQDLKGQLKALFTML